MTTEMSMKRYLPWVMTACAALALLISNGLVLTGLSVFDKPLMHELGLSLGDLKFRGMLTLGLTGLCAPFLGALIDRFGVRRLMIAGGILLIAGYLGYARVTAAWQVYLIHVGFALALVASGLPVAVVLVSQWVVKHRGTALGITVAGSSLSGVVFSKLNVFLLQDVGWRASFEWLALAPVVLLVVAIVLVRSPTQVTASNHSAMPPTAADTRDLGWHEALHTRTFWALAFTACLTFYCAMAATTHLFDAMLDLHFDLVVAGHGLALFFGMALVGQVVFGFVADRVHHKQRLFMANQVVMLAGCVILASLNVHLVWLGIFLFGLGWGGMYTILQLLTVNSFGLHAAGKILGAITVFDTLGGGLGIWMTGVFHDLTGNYALGFGICTVFILIAFLLVTQFRNERQAHRHVAGASQISPDSVDGSR